MDASAAVASSVAVSPRASEVAHAWLRAPLYIELQAEALRRGLHVDVLTAHILASVIILGVIDDVLADARRVVAR